jgi:hypothetical protein
MPFFKSAKYSLAALAALLLVDWYVGIQAANNESNSITDSIYRTNLVNYLPTLAVVHSHNGFPKMDFPDIGNPPQSLIELQTSAFSTTLPNMVMQNLKHQLEAPQPAMPEPQPAIATGFTDTTAVQSTVEAVSNAQADDLPASATTSRKAADAHHAKPTNLVKVLALYYMLNR